MRRFNGCKHLSVFLVFVLLSFSALPQFDTTAFYVKKYTAFDGLPDTYTLDVFQDSRKYLWIGTYSGLSRFDGTTFINFGVRNGFKDLYVSRFIEFENHIWVGNRSSIGYFEKNTFIRTPFEDSAKRLFHVSGFKTVLPGKLWAFTSKGLYEWNKTIWVKSKIIPELKEELCQSAEELNGTLFFCFPDKIVMKFRNGITKTIPAPSGKPEFFQSISKFKNLLFVLSQNGLSELTDNGLLPIFEKTLNKKNITAYFRDSEERFWVATREDGLLVSKPGELQVFSYKIRSPLKLLLSIYEDRGHNIWAADYTGLLKIRKTFFTFPSLPDNHTGAHIYFPFLDAKGHLNIYNNRNALIVFQEGKFQAQQFISDKFFNASEKNLIGVKQLCHDDKHNTWITTRNYKLIKISSGGNQKEIQIPMTKGPVPLSVAFIPGQKKIYCGADELYEIKNDSARLFIPLNTGKPLENIASVFTLKNGNLLVNCRFTGIWVLTTSGNVYNISQKISSLPDDRMNVAEDNSCKLWIALTGKGLLRYRWVNDTLPEKEAEISTFNDGLPNDIIETIATDFKNRLWAATLSGVTVIDTLAGSAGKSFVTFNVSKIDELRSDVLVGQTRLQADQQGNMWLCNGNRVTLFNTAIIDLYTQPPVTHIENLMLSMKKTDWNNWSKKLDSYFMLPENLQLPHNQNTLTFFFKGINFNSDDNIWYSFKLDGVDTTWGPPTQSNSVSFIKLTPANFTFMVRSRNSNSPWSEPVSFSFTIKKPFWQTWWFRAIGILCTSMVLVMLFRVQLKRVRKKAAMENQLHSLEMKSLKAQMNPHFIYNALNSIQSLVIDDKKTDALDYMVKFSRLLRQVLNHSELNVVSLSKELDSLKLYIQLESLRLNYSLNYTISLDEHIIPENEMVPPLILQPIVENSLWHGLSKKQGEKKLTINIRSEEKMLLVEIIDNGIGRAGSAGQPKPESYKEGPRGMNITENRLLIYNENITDKAIITDDLYDSSGIATGTKVTICLKRH